MAANRPNERASERVRIGAPATLKWGEQELTGFVEVVNLAGMYVATPRGAAADRRLRRARLLAAGRPPELPRPRQRRVPRPDAPAGRRRSAPASAPASSARPSRCSTRSGTSTGSTEPSLRLARDPRLTACTCVGGSTRTAGGRPRLIPGRDYAPAQPSAPSARGWSSRPRADASLSRRSPSRRAGASPRGREAPGSEGRRRPAPRERSAARGSGLRSSPSGEPRAGAPARRRPPRKRSDG